jgi:hypothetical protein
MANIFSDVEIESFRLKAKFLSRSNGTKHAQALDTVAHENGFSNWALLMKHGSAQESVVVVVPERRYFQFARTTDEMQHAMRKVQSKDSYHYRVQETPSERITAQIYNEFADGANAVDFAIAFVECLLSVRQFRLHAGSRAYSEMRWWLPYQLATIGESMQVLVNRKYKPVGLRTSDWATYRDYPNLTASLSDKQLLDIAHRPSSQGYLFGDGSAPWHSRQDSERYLERLKLLQGYIKRS